jgi:hypothetical protein
MVSGASSAVAFDDAEKSDDEVVRQVLQGNTAIYWRSSTATIECSA